MPRPGEYCISNSVVGCFNFIHEAISKFFVEPDLSPTKPDHVHMVDKAIFSIGSNILETRAHALVDPETNRDW